MSNVIDGPIELDENALSEIVGGSMTGIRVMPETGTDEHSTAFKPGQTSIGFQKVNPGS